MTSRKNSQGKKNRSFQAPDIVKYKPLYDEDKSILEKLSKTFTKLGVLESKEKVEIRAEASFKEIFEEAKRNAKYENELNPDFYDPAAERLAQLREDEDGDLFDNPSLDGRDDYGHQVYTDSSHESLYSDHYSFTPDFSGKSTIEMLQESLGGKLETASGEDVFQKEGPPEHFDHLDFKNIALGEHRVEDPLNDFSPVVDPEKDELYASILRKARVPNSPGLL